MKRRIQVKRRTQVKHEMNITQAQVNENLKKGNVDFFKQNPHISYNSVSFDKSSMVYAIESGNLELIKYLIQSGYEMTSCSFASVGKTGNMELFNYFAEIHKKSNLHIFYEYCFYNAVEYNQFEMVKHILEVCELDLKKMISRRIVLEHAIRTENFEMIRYIYNKGFTSLYSTSNDGMNGIQFACKKGNFELLKLILEEFEIKVTDGYEINKTIEITIKNGNIEILKYILNHFNNFINSDKNYKYYNKNYYFIIAIENNHIDMFEYLLEVFKINDYTTLENTTNTKLKECLLKYKEMKKTSEKTKSEKCKELLQKIQELIEEVN